MLAGIFDNFKIKSIHIRICILAFCWIVGCVFGTLLSVENADITGALAVEFARQRASLLLLMICQVAPILLVWFIDNSGRYLGVYGICFLRMLVLGYCAGGIYFAFVSAGWLAGIFMMFSAVCVSVPLFWLALKTVAGEQVKRTALIIVVLTAVLVALFDYFVVSVYFSRLILGL